MTAKEITAKEITAKEISDILAGASRGARLIERGTFLLSVKLKQGSQFTNERTRELREAFTRIHAESERFAKALTTWISTNWSVEYHVTHCFRCGASASDVKLDVIGGLQYDDRLQPFRFHICENCREGLMNAPLGEQ